MTEQNKRHAPVVTLTVGLEDNRRTLQLQLDEKRGRGKTAHVDVERLGTKEQAIHLLVERASSWSDQDRRVIRGKAHHLLERPLAPERTLAGCERGQFSPLTPDPSTPSAHQSRCAVSGDLAGSTGPAVAVAVKPQVNR